MLATGSDWHRPRRNKKRYWTVMLSGLLGVFIICNILTPAKPTVLADYTARYPGYASVFTQDEERNRCIVNTSIRLRATRQDYIQSAVMVCDASRAFMNEQQHR